jgi:hypothetical protein
LLRGRCLRDAGLVERRVAIEPIATATSGPPRTTRPTLISDEAAERVGECERDAEQRDLDPVGERVRVLEGMSGSL